VHLSFRGKQISPGTFFFLAIACKANVLLEFAMPPRQRQIRGQQYSIADLVG
jgi:hypothetical protein